MRRERLRIRVGHGMGGGGAPAPRRPCPLELEIPLVALGRAFPRAAVAVTLMRQTAPASRRVIGTIPCRTSRSQANLLRNLEITEMRLKSMARGQMAATSRRMQ